ncbi:hypothetical protein MSAN_01810000 [Mycena sanguinolenta]|uniref:Uncharacterized protein n=1 Tax=Mycena sanguinolenta TaxID=230812 RepID=A0A8H7CQQ5_9AGAR|nr:hypothetical protein MSAN_01810000 [Mycena sanguinolenta]
MFFIFYGILLAVVPSIYAQTSQVYEWGFTGAQVGLTSLPSCLSVSLEADARTANGTPPFYMMAFAVGGTPSTSFIGTNQSNLTWTVMYPVETELVLGVVDALGQSGGIDSPLYTVIEGATTQCVPATLSDPTSGFKISANVTDVLNTCQPWGLTIEGGTPPYNITLAELNSGTVTNVTMGPTDTVFTYINRMFPGGQVIASASDVNGRWATGSPLVRTQGSQDTDCAGLVSTSSSANSNPDGSPSSQSKLHAKIGLIAGVSVVGVLLSSPDVLGSLPTEAITVTPLMRQDGSSLAGAHPNPNSSYTPAPTGETSSSSLSSRRVVDSKGSTVTPDSTTAGEKSSSSPSFPRVFDSKGSTVTPDSTMTGKMSSSSPPSPRVVDSKDLSSAALVAMKRAQTDAVNNLNYSTTPNNMVQTPQGLHLSPATSSYPNSSSRETSPGASAGTTDPTVLQELQTLRHEVRWLATQRTGDEPPPVYT